MEVSPVVRVGNEALDPAEMEAYKGKITHLKVDGDAVSNRSVLCDMATLGLKPKFCTKRDPFGKVKIFSNPQRQWWRPLSNRVKPHSLTNFSRGK